jgi:hypothetical protein
MPPANPIAASAGLPPTQRHRDALEVKRGRKRQQQHAETKLEDIRIGMRDQHRADRHAGQSADHERPYQGEVEAPPHRRQGRGLGNDRADQHQRHGKGRRQDVKPDSQRHQCGAEAGEAGHEPTGDRAEHQQSVGGRVHDHLPWSFRDAPGGTLTVRDGASWNDGCFEGERLHDVVDAYHLHPDHQRQSYDFAYSSVRYAR